ncbi:MAG TPA: beta-propeller fold lactonase family protein [Blastocatellia bacterium]|nr:beta-propeller fold lactonase family protein [Blastocatellia bacterium]
MKLITRSLLISLFVFILFTSDTYAQSNFVYVNTNTPLNTVAAFSVASNGALSPIAGSPFITGGTGNNVGLFAANRSAVCMVANRLYVANDGSNNVTGFDINPFTGFLTIIPGSPFATGGIASGYGMSLDCTPSGQFLIAANGNSSSITVFSIAANGALTPIAGSPFPASNKPNGSKVSPNGKFLYVTEDTNLIEAFNIAASGALTPVPGSPFSGGSFPFGSGVTGIEINCASTLLFAPASGFSTNVSVFNISANGALTPIPGSPFIFAGGFNSLAAVLSPNGQFLFVSSQGGLIAALNVAANGSLSPITGSPFPGVGSGQQLSINQSGSLLYVNSAFGTLGVFSIASIGAVTAVPGSPFVVGSSTLPSVSAFPPKDCAFDFCLQDDSNGNLLKINSRTGDYQFTNCSGFILTGTGTLIKQGSTLTLQHYATDRRVFAKNDGSVNRGSASIQVFSSGITFTIFDRNTANNTCSCPAQ